MACVERCSAAPIHAAIWYLLVLLWCPDRLLIIPSRAAPSDRVYAKMVCSRFDRPCVWLSAVARRQFERPTGLHVLAAAVTMVVGVHHVAGRLIASRS